MRGRRRDEETNFASMQQLNLEPPNTAYHAVDDMMENAVQLRCEARRVGEIP